MDILEKMQKYKTTYFYVIQCNDENIKKDIIDILYPQKNKCFISKSGF